MSLKKSAALGGMLSLLLAASVAGCSKGEEQQAPPPVMPVTVAAPVVQEVLDWDDFVGRFEAIENVELRPRATGYLQAVHFRDGQYVRKGQLLFTIDPRQSQAALAQSQAQLARAQATLANARTELARSRTLAASQAASTEEVEQRLAALRTAEADVAAARAAIRAQQLGVGFTRVTAPISGLVSERRVDPGNSVTADQTVLTTIVSTSPIHFAFDGSEALLLKYQRQNAGSRSGTQVRIRLQDEASYVHAGTLDFVDTTVNAGAGTVRGRAVVPNPNNFLKPGMFGHMRLAASQPYRALLVPETAIVTDAARRVVYVVSKDGTVLARPVELGPLNGALRVIRSGLAPQEQVIIDGLQRARPGQKVKPTPGRIQAATGPEPTPQAPALQPSSIATPVGGAPAAGR
ncbi:efflux RND transporter periplasmic adaptor subunit [Sphingosinicella sp. BN140058]|uniref:efflux RND transporter periplasmic adaptor subunit n=1 Tax=Sphingosinicella sp. BN140058 TaxID=1892855 RepID=UPI00197DD807|nr:efflux RND transporter periplasmic adaptor subunit [Sphingosinicella sp. BN140058]